MTTDTFFVVLVVVAAVMGVWGIVKRTNDARRYRQAPPDLSGFSQTIDSRSSEEPR